MQEQSFLKHHFLLVLLFVSLITNAQVFDVRKFGAVGDGKTMNTKAIQAAIDECGMKGGEVLLSGGVYLSGTLYLRSNITLRIAEGTTLKGSSSFADYPDNKVNYINACTHREDGSLYANKALLFAEGVTGLSVTGKGTIDGSGDSPAFQLGNDVTPESKARPFTLLIIDSKKISVSDLFLTNSAYWMQNYLGCDGLELKNLRVFNQSNYNQDGMDIDSRNVLVENCTLDVDDDAICFKSHDRNRIPENIIVRNCVIASNCNAIKFGTTSIGGLKNVRVSDCIIQKASASHIRNWQGNLQFIGQPVTVLSGIALESVDGAFIDDINISGIKMQDVQTPFFIVLGDRGRKPVRDTIRRIGHIRNIELQDITAVSQSKMSSFITAIPGHYVEKVSLRNIHISTMGKGTWEEAQQPLMENIDGYPENRMYGQVFPASGVFVRHVKDLRFEHIVLQLREMDQRPVIVLDDVLGCTIDKLQADLPEPPASVIRVIQGEKIVIRKSALQFPSGKFLELLHTPSKEVTVNDCEDADY